MVKANGPFGLNCLSDPETQKSNVNLFKESYTKLNTESK